MKLAVKIEFLLFSLLLGAISVNSHPQLIYKTKEEASSQAIFLECKGIHVNGNYWMPFFNEKELHKALRRR